MSNDFRWKNQKFKQSYPIRFEYSPQVTIDIPKIDEPWFYDKADSINADSKYRVKELLEKKFGKRNMAFNDNSELQLKIEKLVFKEYAESVTVDGVCGGSIGDSSKDYFVFEISGSLMRNDSVITAVSAKHEYNNEPQESIFFDGVIVMGGGNARADKMIENTINEFTYRVYQAITNPETATH